ncbi:MAG: SigE family RNA polymerase sigma factor [Streptosporangiaceae bacterium]|nr:SigE family RNA polymerase sigma factor [Streptosporangiaceae bacterium]
MADAGGTSDAVQAAVTAVYEAHALGLVRLAHVMLSDRAAAEDVVQEAFCGLYRRWDRLAGPDKALAYVRSSVLNGCRSVLRRKSRSDIGEVSQPLATSAESAVLAGEQRRQVMRLLRQLPDRQREVLVLRFYLELSDAEIARQLGIGPSTVRSTTSRALAALARALGETS